MKYMPRALIAEITHSCPLHCVYCSNPLELQRRSAELSTEDWISIFQQARELGVLQLHLTGGEPLSRSDLTELVRAGRKAHLYLNLITSGVGLDGSRLDQLIEAGLDHIQLSFQDTEEGSANEFAGTRSHALKLRVAGAIRERRIAFTINLVVHRRNVDRLGEMLTFAEHSGAQRLEIAHVQYYAWALKNRDALLPSRQQLDEATRVVEAARAKLKGVLAIDYVVPDYHGVRPKSCMNGWGRQFLNITPSGKAVPCHAAETLPGIAFPSVRDGSLADIWYRSDAFNRFRGTDWMAEPCRSCERREIDWGGCRCQAFLLAGDASRADPVCALSPDHGVVEAALQQAEPEPKPLVYRQYN